MGQSGLLRRPDGTLFKLRFGPALTQAQIPPMLIKPNATLPRDLTAAEQAQWDRDFLAGRTPGVEISKESTRQVLTQSELAARLEQSEKDAKLTLEAAAARQDAVGQRARAALRRANSP